MTINSEHASASGAMGVVRSGVASDGLPPGQLRVLRAIWYLSETKGFPPTLREIGELTGIRSTNGVTDHLKALRRKGCVTWAEMHARTLRVTDAGRSLLAMVGS
jgi:repressor LexA